MGAKCTLKDPDRTEHAYPSHLAGSKPQQFRSSCIRSVVFTTWRTITEDGLTPPCSIPTSATHDLLRGVGHHHVSLVSGSAARVTC